MQLVCVQLSSYSRCTCSCNLTSRNNLTLRGEGWVISLLSGLVLRMIYSFTKYMKFCYFNPNVSSDSFEQNNIKEILKCFPFLQVLNFCFVLFWFHKYDQSLSYIHVYSVWLFVLDEWEVLLAPDV